MNVSIDPRWGKFIEQAAQDGRYGSASDVVREGLRLVEEREAKLSALRETIQRSIAAGRDVSEEELDAFLEAEAAKLAKEGFRLPPLRYLGNARLDLAQILAYITRESGNPATGRGFARQL
ncbi:type II toxin-antitoxin system ParD family antitoxin [Neorhizobium galegae]|uniref:type II toxin-antitoxin system ParD family antitoxin n=1 Tax=Neorhizobium galegae TaxID=399 RepID=UPI0006222919|nr:type II toxin-antitoxin system ParD family antitoxin [Neorhizobium galegae]KAA9386269.1 type II toxin-antitoxin system ParD family antitoxin [Neorhizobium galegae]KAB1112874.1 type II toxin-antitoxin system ParD family antitoxin [Neorhizobium galegae]CDZ29515.1 Hypothetical protein NGAL_HAMBI490_43820 [Neorhizobium galegae bv. officinalis]